MSDNVIKLPVAISADDVLGEASGHFEECLILGYTPAGNLEARISASLKPNEILWMIERFRHRLLDGDFFE